MDVGPCPPPKPMASGCSVEPLPAGASAAPGFDGAQPASPAAPAAKAAVAPRPKNERRESALFSDMESSFCAMWAAIVPSARGFPLSRSLTLRRGTGAAQRMNPAIFRLLPKWQGSCHVFLLGKRARS